MSEDRELGLVVIGVGCVLAIFISIFGAVWVFYGLGWAFMSGFAYSLLLLIVVLDLLSKTDKS